MTRLQIVIGLATLTTAVGACAKEVPVVDVKGDCAVAYEGEVCTWAMMQDTTVLEIGLKVPVARIQNAPPEAPMEWPPVAAATLAFPKAAQAQTGLTEMTMYWEAQGHPPAPYLTPHFDFHFYLIPPSEVATIDCLDESKPPVLPPGYSLPDMDLPPAEAQMIGVSTLVGVCVPQMGMHSMLTSELEGTDLFRGTMIVGYYQGKAIFIEPMLSQALLMEKQSFDLAIPEVPGLNQAHPRAFRAEYDPEHDAYNFVFTDFAPGA